MIVTVTPNLAFDRTVVLDELKPGKVNRAKKTRVDLGGIGSRGSITVTADGAFITPALNVKVRGTVGAGDAMVAGFALALDQSLSLTDAVKIAAAASSAAVTREGTEPVDFDTFKALLSQVKIEKVPL
jgi:1-phosphofructokinase